MEEDSVSRRRKLALKEAMPWTETTTNDVVSVSSPALSSSGDEDTEVEVESVVHIEVGDVMDHACMHPVDDYPLGEVELGDGVDLACAVLPMMPQEVLRQLLAHLDAADFQSLMLLP